MSIRGSCQPQSGPTAHAHNWTLGIAIRAPETGRSLSAIFPVSSSPTGHFGKEQSGTDFGKASAPGDRCRFGKGFADGKQRVLE
jgi:hypothetical protein